MYHCTLIATISRPSCIAYNPLFEQEVQAPGHRTTGSPSSSVADVRPFRTLDTEIPEEEVRVPGHRTTGLPWSSAADAF